MEKEKLFIHYKTKGIYKILPGDLSMYGEMEHPESEKWMNCIVYYPVYIYDPVDRTYSETEYRKYYVRSKERWEHSFREVTPEEREKWSV